VIAVLCGGVGAARLLSGLVDVVEPAQIHAVVNVGDDLVLHGLAISPDLDTITYTLSGEHNAATGWGLRDETWRAIDALGAFGAETWFRLGDRDLGTHLYRTGRLAQGAPLSVVTREIAARFGLGIGITPVTDDSLRTVLTLEGGADVYFQEYFVRLAHAVPVAAVRFEGAERARPAPGVLDLLERADRILVAPSNPIVSIAPILAVPGVTAVLERRRDDVIAISPIVGGRALKGPADRLLRELGGEASAVGVARVLASIAGTLVIDTVDDDLRDAVRATGVRCVVTDTVMGPPGVAAALAATALGAGSPR
jgi:LPPG:FO 2-phospho-L-lactate transferase